MLWLCLNICLGLMWNHPNFDWKLERKVHNETCAYMRTFCWCRITYCSIDRGWIEVYKGMLNAYLPRNIKNNFSVCANVIIITHASSMKHSIPRTVVVWSWGLNEYRLHLKDIDNNNWLHSIAFNGNKL